MAVYLDFSATSEYTSWYVRPTTYSIPWTYGGILAGQQAPHELPFMVQPTQQGLHWHPNYGQHPSMPVPPQPAHQQALPFPNCYPETTQLCRTAHLPQQVPPMFFPQNCPQPLVPQLQVPGTSPVQESPVHPIPMPHQQQFVVPKPTETTTLPTSHQALQATPSETPGLDLKALENRLDAALEKKFENMATSLKQSLTSPIPGTLPASSTPVTSSTPGTPAPAVGTATTSGQTSPQPGDISRVSQAELPVKDKPPTPPDQAQGLPSGDRPSRNSLRSPWNRDKKSSRRSRSRRRFTHRRREPSQKAYRHESDRRTTMTRSTHDRHHPRTERPTTTPRTSRTEPNEGRRRDHPIFRRANTFRQVHQDGNSTVYTKEAKDKTKFTYGSNFLHSRQDSNITLRSRSKSRQSKRPQTALAIFERPPGVLLVAKARPDRPKSPEDTAPRGTSVSEATESQKVESLQQLVWMV